MFNYIIFCKQKILNAKIYEKPQHFGQNLFLGISFFFLALNIHFTVYCLIVDKTLNQIPLIVDSVGSDSVENL